MRLTDVIIDSQDPERLAAFWAEVLGRPIGARIGPFVFLDRADGPGVGFQKTDEPKTGKNRVHVDVRSPDPAAERGRLEALGARIISGAPASGIRPLTFSATCAARTARSAAPRRPGPR